MLRHDARREVFCRAPGGNVARVMVAVDPSAQGIAPNHGIHHRFPIGIAIRVELYRDGICIQVIQIYGDSEMMHFPF